MSVPISNAKCDWCGAPALEPRGWNGKTAIYCKDHKAVEGRDPLAVGRTAVFEAMELQETETEGLIRWPFREVDRVAGVLVPRRLYYVAAFPGNGKTSFLSHCYASWVDAGFRVTYLPLESDPLETVTRVACARAGVSSDDALSMRLKIAADAGNEKAIQQRHDLMVAFRLLLEDREFWDLFRIEPSMTLTPKVFQSVVQAVQAMESDILLVDHVDNAEADADDMSPEIRVSNTLQMMALHCARTVGIPVVLATQLNSSKVSGDRLAHYRPPIMDWLYNKGKKEQVAAVCLGLFRPLDERLDDDTLSSAKSGLVPAWKVAKPNTMGVALMKGRYSGAMKDSVIELHYEQGRLKDAVPDFYKEAA